MLKLSAIEFIFRALPEAFLLVFAIATFSKVKLKIPNLLISGCVMSVLFLLIRSLPINYGVHTILIIISCVLMSYFYNKIDIIKCTKAAILVLILQLICEGLNILIIENLLGLNITYVFNHPVLKVFYGLPSLLILWVVILSSFFVLKRRNILLDV